MTEIPTPSRRTVRNMQAASMPASAAALVIMAFQSVRGDGANAHRINAIEVVVAAVDARERANRDEMMRLLIDVKTAIGRIEGKMEENPR